MSNALLRPIPRVRWASSSTLDLADWGTAPLMEVDQLPQMPTRSANPEVAAWPACWRSLHNPAWVRSVWQRLQWAIQQPVDSTESPEGRVHVVLGLMRFDESPDGRLCMARWKRTQKGMAWTPLPAEAVEFEDLPNGHTWQADLYAACAWEVDRAERAAGRVPNAGHIHGYVYRCITPMLRTLRQQPAWRTLGRRIQAGLHIDSSSLTRARHLLRFDRSTQPCTLDLYNLALGNRALFDRAQTDAGNFACAQLMLGALLRVQSLESNTDPLTRVRRELMDTGRDTFKPSTWRLLLRMGVDQLRVVETYYEGPTWPAVVDFLRCLEFLDLRSPPPAVLLHRLFSKFANSSWRHPSHIGQLEHLGTNVAHAVRCAAQSDDPVAAAEDLPQVLDWLEQVTPSLSKMQRRAGWAWLRQRSIDWHEAQHVRWQISGESIAQPFEPMQWGEYRLESIHEAVALFDEGVEMNHCIFSRKDAMLRGTSLIVSIKSRGAFAEPWSRVATAEYRHEADSGWLLREVQGYANQDPGKRVRTIAERVPEALREMESEVRSREFYCPRSAPFRVRQRRGCPIQPMVEVRLHRLGRDLPVERCVSAEDVAGMFWWIERTSKPLSAGGGRAYDHDVVTTEEVFEWMERGHFVLAMDGPFKTHEDGSYALDVAWEAPE